MLVLGITGTNGAGKGTIVDYLVKKHAFLHFSVRDFLEKQVLRKGLPVNRDTLVAMGNKIRSEKSPDFIINKLYKQAHQSGQNAIIESIRSLGEAQAIKNLGGILIAVDASPNTRFSHIQKRKSEKDNVTYKTFLENDKREEKSSDLSKQNLLGCIALADYKITNNGTLVGLHAKVKKILDEIQES